MTIRARIAVSRSRLEPLMRMRTRAPSLTPRGMRSCTGWRTARWPSRCRQCTSRSRSRRGRRTRDRGHAPAGRRRWWRRRRPPADVTTTSGTPASTSGSAEKRMAHPIEDGGDRRKIDRDFVASGSRRPPSSLLTRNVRVIATRQLPMGALDFVCACIRRYAEHIVVVAHDFQSIVLQKRCRRPSTKSRLTKRRGIPKLEGK